MTAYKPKERQDLEELYRKQNVRINQLEQEKKKIKESEKRYKNQCYFYVECIRKLEKEKKKLKEFKTKREENMFYFKTQIERTKPKTTREAEDLQRTKELFKKLYREKLNYLEEENKKLKADSYNELQRLGLENYELREENKKLKKENEKLKGQEEEPYLLFIKTIWTTENKSGFYIFRNVKDNNYELRSFNSGGQYSLSQTFDTIEGAIEYAKSIKTKN